MHGSQVDTTREQDPAGTGGACAPRAWRSRKGRARQSPEQKQDEDVANIPAQGLSSSGKDSS